MIKSSLGLRLFIFFVFLFFSYNAVFAQQLAEESDDLTAEQADEQPEEKQREYRPREKNLLVDISLAAGEVTLTNIVGNIFWRFGGSDKEAAYVSLDSIRNNFRSETWFMELGVGGDTFVTNQFFHPYAGGLYFASARSNNLNFYQSMFFSVLGSLQWETLCESEFPALNDFINTSFSGIIFGEIMHRLYIELRKSGKKIGATLISPTSRITDAVRGYGPEKGPSLIRDSSLDFGFTLINAKFFEESDEVSAWNSPSAFINFNLVYGDPYTARSVTPFTQFDLNMSAFAALPIGYNLTFITDGYLASWLLADNEVNQASNGLTLHFDFFSTYKGSVMDRNNGKDNLCTVANSIDYSIKWQHTFNNSLEFSMKTHIGFTPWAVANYNGGVNRFDGYLYSFGGNIKLFLEMIMKNKQSLSLGVCLYNLLNIPETPGLKTNTIFVFSNISYSFPFNDRISLYLADSFHFLYCRLIKDEGPEFHDTTSWLNTPQIGIRISF